MSAWAILLRLLLAFALVFNGAATAMASVHMAQGTMEVATKPGQATAGTAEVPPCHQAASISAAEHPMAVDSAPSKSKHPVRDCCKSGLCGCTCTSVASMAVNSLMHRLLYIRTAMVRTEASGHRAPSLPHLIRPPIG